MGDTRHAMTGCVGMHRFDKPGHLEIRTQCHLAIDIEGNAPDVPDPVGFLEERMQMTRSDRHESKIGVLHVGIDARHGVHQQQLKGQQAPAQLRIL